MDGEGHSEIRQTVLLTGSAAQCIEQLDFSLNYIVHQRNVYPNAAFERRWEYGTTIYETTNAELRRYFRRIKHVLLPLVESRRVKTVDLVIKNIASSIDLERWRFVFNTNVLPPVKKEVQIAQDCFHDAAACIQRIFHSIATSLSYLPLIEGSGQIEVQLETYTDTSIPEARIKVEHPALSEVNDSGTDCADKEQKCSP